MHTLWMTQALDGHRIYLTKAGRVATSCACSTLRGTKAAALHLQHHCDAITSVWLHVASRQLASHLPPEHTHCSIAHRPTVAMLIRRKCDVAFAAPKRACNGQAAGLACLPATSCAVLSFPPLIQIVNFRSISPSGSSTPCRHSQLQ